MKWLICEIIGHKYEKDITISHEAGEYIFCKCMTEMNCPRCNKIHWDSTTRFPIQVDPNAQLN